MQRYENRLLAMLFVTNGLLFFDRLAINFLTPYLHAEFNLSGLQIGALTSALSLTWATSGIVVSRLADRHAIKKLVLVVAIVVFSVSSVSSGLAAGFLSLLVARCVMGVAEGPVLPVVQTLMMVESTPRRRGFNMGFIQAVAAGVFGSLLGPALIIPLAHTHGWRTAFYLTGIPGLILALVLWRFVNEPSLTRVASALHRVDDAEAEVKAKTKTKTIRPLANRNVMICAAMACLFLTTFYSVMVFGPLHLMAGRGYTDGQMSGFMIALGAAAVVGGALMPALSDRLGRKPTLLIGFLLASSAPAVVAFVQADFTILCVGIFVAWLGMGVMPVMLATVPAESVEGVYANRAIGWVIGISEVIGGCVSPVLCGAAADKYGASAPFVVGIISAVLAALLVTGLRETAPGRVARAAARSSTPDDEQAPSTVSTIS
ncbi:major facilitator transporter [Caballeronia hypogeia]|uniref:Major facilitator transporter n=1 Tax=Caballeronia hypogeia TaxID=1777140 RepID=A0A158CVP0_9BURK|nr:MFS transporter [Caballeronia hypogeia]SAK86443.1 major facilitator transporter [Caballeronia hypogeia]